MIFVYDHITTIDHRIIICIQPMKRFFDYNFMYELSKLKITIFKTFLVTAINLNWFGINKERKNCIKQ